jgi:hypothetical protein
MSSLGAERRSGTVRVMRPYEALPRREPRFALVPFDETIEFPNYEPRDLELVLAHFADSEDYELTPDAEVKAASVLKEA